eukprot:TRINITY_DN1278_c0_g1_i6.p1 TRINITY_DN1278_c0_g1~~TRINITY_DN1278_c0_g1_i6.p1  ORF type:complete len:135 (-),score=12.94 TRINITY_DN1278_c0_g1_i6:6-410(-)
MRERKPSISRAKEREKKQSKGWGQQKKKLEKKPKKKREKKQSEMGLEKGGSSWKVGRAHEEAIDFTSSLSAFSDGPHHEGLTTTAITSSKHLALRSRVLTEISLEVASHVEVNRQVSGDSGLRAPHVLCVDTTA